MKMISVGYKMKNDGVMPSSGKDKMHYPSIRFSEKIPAHVKKKDVGDKCMFYVEGEVVSKSMDEYGESMAIDIHSISADNNSTNKEDYDKMSHDDKDKADEKDVMGDK